MLGARLALLKHLYEFTVHPSMKTTSEVTYFGALKHSKACIRRNATKIAPHISSRANVTIPKISQSEEDQGIRTAGSLPTGNADR